VAHHVSKVEHDMAKEARSEVFSAAEDEDVML
jgi:hypothetical protein